MNGVPIRLFLSGCGGRMGRVIDRLVLTDERFVIVAGSDTLLPENAGYPVYANLDSFDTDYDVLIDFSHPSAFSSLLTLSRQTGKPAVFCTTGLSDEQNAALKILGREQAVFQSANMSLGINVLVMLAKKATAALFPDFDIEIVEAHHNQKLDAPSGTAYMIGNAIKETRDALLLNDQSDQSSEFVYNRHERREKRGTNEIGMHAIRGGSIVGDHDVLFAGQDEIIRISHHAASRDIFGRGALSAARFMAGKKPGFYTMADLIESL